MLKESARLPPIAIVAVVCGLLFALLVELAGIRQTLLLPASLLPLYAAVGILLIRVWSAYGYALYQVASVISIPLMAQAETASHSLSG